MDVYFKSSCFYFLRWWACCHAYARRNSKLASRLSRDESLCAQLLNNFQDAIVNIIGVACCGQMTSHGLAYDAKTCKT
jgi:hypothetical protein